MIPGEYSTHGVKILGFFTIIGVILAISSKILYPLNQAQIICIVIFLSFLTGSLLFWQFRNAIALIGLSLLLFCNVLDIPHLIQFGSFDIIIFLVGMMIIMGYLEKEGCFDYLIKFTIQPFTDRPTLVVAILLFMGTITASILDEVASILIMSAILLKVLKGYGVEGEKVFPFIMFLVFTTNIGSSALPVGNPIGVLIAFKAGFTFLDFLRWSFPLALLNSILVIGIGIIYLRRTTDLCAWCLLPLHASDESDLKLHHHTKTALIVFFVLLLGFFLQSPIEQALSLSKNTLFLGIPLIMAGIVLFMGRYEAHELVEHVDWWTLLYFICLFATVGSLQYTGITGKISSLVSGISGDSVLILLLMGIIICILTAFMDNILAVATIAPLVESFRNELLLKPLWWIMLIGGTYFGNATPIGSTANIVAMGFIEKNKCGTVRMGSWIKLGIPISILTFAIAFILLILQFF